MAIKTDTLRITPEILALIADFRQLVEKGYLLKQGGGRSTWYVLS